MKDLYKIILLIAAVCSTTVLMAQPLNPPATPIDGGLSLLLLAGGAYGMKKLRDKRK
ncbi:MAG: hypothetical protein JXR10_00165 [Cyclobacteriaceae bacterium]